METQTHAHLVAQILYGPDTALPDATAFLGTLNAELARFGIELHSDGQSDDGGLRFAGPRVGVALRRVSSPCPSETLDEALGAPILAVKASDLARRARAHASHADIAVFTPEGADPLPWHLRFVVLHRAIVTLFDISDASAACLPASAMLFDRSEIEASRDMTVPLTLCLHPIPIAAPDVPVISGVLPPLGIVALGSERFCDKLLVLAPSPLPLREGLALLARLLRDHAGNIRALEDGSQFDDLGHGGVFVRHGAPDEGAPNGRIIVGLGDWPDARIAQARPLSLSDMAPDAMKASAPRELPPSMMSRAMRLALSPNGLTVIAALVLYLTFSHVAANWMEGQSDLIRSSLGATGLPKSN